MGRRAVNPYHAEVVINASLHDEIHCPRTDKMPPGRSGLEPLVGGARSGMWPALGISLVVCFSARPRCPWLAVL